MRPHRRTLGLAVVGALLVIGLLGWAARDHGPRYQGSGVNYWFPRLGKTTAQDEPWHQLGRAGPEVVPLLVAAANLNDGRIARGYQRLHGKLPRGFARILPELQSAATVQTEVVNVIVAHADSPEFCRALTNSFANFPEFVQRHVLRWMSQARTSEEIVAPTLLGSLRQTNLEMSLVASESLLSLPRARYDHVREIADALAAWPVSEWTNSLYLARGMASKLEALGTKGSAAVPWAATWLTSSIPILRANAASTLAGLSPEAYPLVPTFLRQLPELGPREISWALDRRAERFAPRPPDWLGLLVALAPLLDPEATPQSQVPGMPAPMSTNALRSLRYALLAALEHMGAEAAPAANFLPAMLTDSEAEKTGKSVASLLAKIGPVAPQTIPRLLPGLTNEHTAPPLVLLLAAYGHDAKASIPQLTRLAQGELARSGRGSYRASETIRKRYGVQIEPSPSLGSASLPVLPEIALAAGLTRFWPLPPELRAQTNLLWSLSGRADRPPPPGRGLVPPVTLSELAAEALRHIQN